MAKKKEKKEKIEINAVHYVEILDRTHVIVSNIEDHLLSHPLVQQKKKIRKKIEEAVTALAIAYENVAMLVPPAENKTVHDDLPF